MATINLVKQIRARKDGRKDAEAAAPSALQNMRIVIDLDRGERVRAAILAAAFASIFLGKALVATYTSTMAASVQSQIAEYDQQIAAEQQKLASFKSIEGEISSYEAKMREARDKLTIIEGVRKNRNALVRMLDFVVGEMPSSIWLTKVTIDNTPGGTTDPGGSKQGTVQVTGFAISLQLVSEFMKRLEGAVFFPRWELVETNNQPGSATTPAPQGSTAGASIPPDAKSFDINARIVTL
jgi:Tfp pilus assembly protein PilN